MNAVRVLLLSASLVPVLTSQQPAVPKTQLKVGDVAPDFTLPSIPSGAPVKLSQFRGKKPVVLAFFPAAFTGG